MTVLERPQPRPGVLKIQAYVPGKSSAPGVDKVYKLSSNETPLGASPAAIAAYRDLADHLELYPDGSATRLREDLAALGIARAEANSEPEDHAATLCEIMAGLAAGRFPASQDAQRAFFEKHLSRWMGRFFADLEKADGAKFYRSVGALGRVFLEIEAEAFTFAN